jgi:hypothetical protein
MSSKSKLVGGESMLIKWLMPVLASLTISAVATLIAYQNQYSEVQQILPAYQGP